MLTEIFVATECTDVAWNSGSCLLAGTLLLIWALGWILEGSFVLPREHFDSRYCLNFKLDFS